MLKGKFLSCQLHIGSKLEKSYSGVESKHIQEKLTRTLFGVCVQEERNQNMLLLIIIDHCWLHPVTSLSNNQKIITDYKQCFCLSGRLDLFIIYGLEELTLSNPGLLKSDVVFGECAPPLI